MAKAIFNGPQPIRKSKLKRVSKVLQLLKLYIIRGEAILRLLKVNLRPDFQSCYASSLQNTVLPFPKICKLTQTNILLYSIFYIFSHFYLWFSLIISLDFGIFCHILLHNHKAKQIWEVFQEQALSKS